MKIIQLFSVFAKIGLNDQDFKRGLDRAEMQGREFADIMSKVSNTVTSKITMLGATLAELSAISTKMGENFYRALFGVSSQAEQTTKSLKILTQAVNATENAKQSAIAPSEEMTVLMVRLNEATSDFNSSLEESANFLNQVSLAQESVKENSKYLLDFIEIFAEIKDSISKFAETILNITEKITKYLPIFKERGEEIVKYLLKGIMKSLPYLFAETIKIIPNMSKSMLEKLSIIENIGVSLVTSLWSGISERITWIYSKIGNFAGSIVTQMRDSLGIASTGDGNGDSTIFSSIGNGLGSGLMSGLKDSIFGKISSVLTATNDMSNAVMERITDVFSRSRELGANMMEGLKDGINSVAARVVDSARDVASRAVNGVRDFLGINSPSRVFANIGENSVEGYIVGLKKKERDLYKAMGELFESVSLPEESLQYSTIKQTSKIPNNYTVNDKKATLSSSSHGEIHYHFAANSIVIDSKSVKEFSNIVELLNDYTYNQRVYNGV